VEAQRTNDAFDVNVVFTKVDLVVISAVTAGRKVHRVLVDQGSLTNVMFWTTFNKLQLSPDMLRPYDNCLYGFAGDQVEERGYLELRTTFKDGTASRTESIRYLVVNAFSAYNMLLGKPTLNRLRAVSSTKHMKMKLPDLIGKVITIKSDQKEAKRCYENSLKARRGVSIVTNGPPYTEGSPLPKISRSKPDEAIAEIARRTKSDPFGNSGEREIGERVSNLSKIPDQMTQTPVEKTVESRTGVTSDDRLGDQFGPRTETGSVSRSYIQGKQSMLRAWREMPGTKECNPISFTPGLSRVEKFPQENKDLWDEARRLKALKQGSVPCTWNAADFKSYFS